MVRAFLGESDLPGRNKDTLFELLGIVQDNYQESVVQQTTSAECLSEQILQRAGLPKRAFRESMLDGSEELIREALKYKITVSSIARTYGVARSTMVWFIRTRGLGSQGETP
jgi:hypothetical protein